MDDDDRIGDDDAPHDPLDPEESDKLAERVRALLAEASEGVVPVTPHRQLAVCFRHEGEAFVTFDRVTYPVLIGKDRAFESDLGLAIQAAWWQEARAVLTPTLLNETMLVLRASGKFGKRCIPVATRVGGDGVNRIVIDLGEHGNDDVIDVTAEGWVIHPLGNDETIRFVRPGGSQPMTRPTHVKSSGDIPALQVLGLEKEAQHRCLAWLLNALRPGDHPAPLLVVEGAPGSGKSILTAELQRLTDPRTAGVRALPASIRDLMACALNARVLSFTNASTVSPELSDALCRLASGEATATRTLFTTAGQVTCDGVRPMILNGVAGLLTRGDLADRSLVIELPDRTERKSENVLRQQLREARSITLGRLCGLLSTGLRAVQDDRIDAGLSNLHRMSDAVVWSAACLGNKTARQIWAPVAPDAHLRMLDGWVPGERLVEVIKTSRRWEGKTSDLSRLIAGGKTGDGWPKTPHHWSAELRLNQAALAEAGVRVEFLPRKMNVRLIRLTWIGG